jgi:hypothetical protein
MKKNWYVNDANAVERQATFFGDIEQITSDHVIMLEEYFCGLGLSIKDVRKLAFDLVEPYKVANTFNKETKFAGKKEFYAFMRRNPQLSVRQPEATSLATAKGFNRDNVLHFFICRKAILQNLGLHLTRYTLFTKSRKNQTRTVPENRGQMVTFFLKED